MGMQIVAGITTLAIRLCYPPLRGFGFLVSNYARWLPSSLNYRPVVGEFPFLRDDPILKILGFARCAAGD